MCVIIIKQKIGQRLPLKQLKSASTMNPHGLGIVWLDDYTIEFHTSKEYKLLDTDRPFIAHFRWASVGKICKQNIHPFPCGTKHNEWLMMNGTIWGKGSAAETDTAVLARELGDIPRERWADTLKIYNCRFVTINVHNHSFQVFNHELWTQVDGVWYSNEYLLQNIPIAVYGTLRKGCGNYLRLLKNTQYIGKGKTADKYPLVVNGLPMLFEHKGQGYKVCVDVFMVSAAKLKEIDGLEGHPTFYERVQIPIKMTDGKIMKCWVYFQRRSDFEKYTKKDFTNSYMKYVKERDSFFYTPAKPVIGFVKGAIYPAGPLAKHETLCDRPPISSLFDTTNDEEEDDSDTPLLEDEKPVCPDCFHDVEYDGFQNYYCAACGGWFKEDEVRKFRT